ncbi:MAG: hypothetical protein U9N18_02780 [Campylobacterota bacterium]|nr:hypothetical protein [Campylobacterota bacterium]
MGVSDRVREIEREIDANICQLLTWRAPRAEVLEDLMRTYRDAIEFAFLKALHTETFDGSAEDSGAALGQENRSRAGSLWALKWAAEYCPESAPTAKRSPKELVDLLLLGDTYETFVDALKYAQRSLITIKVEEASRRITFYEGGPATAFDAHIVQHQRITSPMIPHVSLTEDSDQLTSRWTAGDYRRVTKWLAEHAAHEENTIFVDPAFLTKIGKSKISIPQPTLVWFDRPANAPDCYVFDDLVLPVIDDVLKWRLVFLLDTPIVQVGDRFCTLSSDIKTITSIDDYMLRLAARVDPDQYSKASTLREGRMISICRDALEQCVPPWSVVEHVLYKDPPQEVDVLASRDAKNLILQLKSTLRPETPWEVYKRNEGLIEGVKHTKRLVDRGAANQGFVVTDGYRGDYTCWAEALASDIPIATLYDVEVIALDPVEAASEVKRRVGITASAQELPQGVPDREVDLMGWTLRFVDRHAPTGNTDD